MQLSLLITFILSLAAIVLFYVPTVRAGNPEIAKTEQATDEDMKRMMSATDWKNGIMEDLAIMNAECVRINQTLEYIKARAVEGIGALKIINHVLKDSKESLECATKIMEIAKTKQATDEDMKEIMEAFEKYKKFKTNNLEEFESLKAKVIEDLAIMNEGIGKTNGGGGGR
eukprot:GHVS01034925.1.p1 GENE.GHVS01034925.1~~GHVS01034925.1.p1  ORF type:complete len:171 (+),score=34.48 GHVS01034925.1:59-571(+)